MSNSIIDVLNDSIQNFRQTRARNNSRPSPNPRSRDTSVNKLNTSSDSEKVYMGQSSLTSKKPVQVSEINLSSKHNRHDSFTKILDSDSFLECRSPDKPAPPAEDSEELQKLFKEIEFLKKDQKQLEDQVQVLESKICENLKNLHEPLKQTDFNDIIDRITRLQGKFANRGKSSLMTEKLSDLFGKLSKLESEAENIRRENTEVENLYHESLNEIYNKIDKLKKENKTLTDIILSNSSNSPKQTRKFISSYEESIAKISEKEENKLDLVSQERAELESERFRIEKEISEIPASSKSLANKKKRQTLEKELADVTIRLENLLR